MAGHSKWANIKHRKGKADAIKGKLFSRLTKEIISAVKQGGSDPKSNVKLRMAIQKARAANLPNENIERNIKRASSADQSEFSQVVYELYGYGGVGIVVQLLTDNKNRAASDMRIATNKKGGTIATPGAVTFNFDQKGVIEVLRKNASEESLFLAATEAGAEDFEAVEECFFITTAADQLFEVKEKLDQLSIVCETVELQMIPKTFIECDAQLQKLNLELIDYLENLEDVDAVYHNMKLA